MRKLLLTTAAVAAAIGLAGCGKKEPVPETPNTFTDTRDGQTYKTVKIGKQTWMAENLNYRTKRGSWCYDGIGIGCNNDSISYCKKYGRLYDWKTAKKACPTGWTLPDTADWNMLVTTVGEKEAGKKLKSKNGWNNWEDGSNGNGTDDYGFSALPGSGCVPNGYFDIMGDFGRWWTATKYVSKDWNNSAYFRGMYEYDYVYSGHSDKTNGLSVRCVADRP